MSVVEQWIEEDLFTALCIHLEGIGVNDPEESAHSIMDVWTKDGVLDVEGLVRAINRGLI